MGFDEGPGHIGSSVLRLEADECAGSAVAPGPLAPVRDVVTALMPPAPALLPAASSARSATLEPTTLASHSRRMPV